jgi:Matrixin
VTDSKKPGTPDITLRYVPHAGGTQWGGVANCGVQKCLNVIVKSDTPDGHSDEPDAADVDAVRVQRIAIHELGHALGLGHAAPLETSRDIMGYGWSVPDPDVTPILSDCDLAGIRAAFSWVFANEAPHGSPVDSVVC